MKTKKLHLEININKYYYINNSKKNFVQNFTKFDVYLKKKIKNHTNETQSFKLYLCPNKFPTCCKNNTPRKMMIKQHFTDPFFSILCTI